jgi:hypothetical protein
MPCMCGDFCCPSCGPAQGNSRCAACGEWASEGCDCTPEAIAEAERQEAIRLEAEEAMYKQMEKDAEEYWRTSSTEKAL